MLKKAENVQIKDWHFVTRKHLSLVLKTAFDIDTFGYMKNTKNQSKVQIIAKIARKRRTKNYFANYDH